MALSAVGPGYWYPGFNGVMVKAVANDEALVWNRGVNYLLPPAQTPASFAAMSQGLCFKEFYIFENLRQCDCHDQSRL